ncbi:MAG: alpha/beta hydrolase [Pseudomonadota bacterium]
MKFSLKALLLASCMTAGLSATGLAQASLGAWVQDKALGLEQYRAGLTTSMVSVDGHDIKVFTRHLDSSEPCIVMIHGFTARGAHWFRMAQKMPDDRCVIALDLPGFGDSTFIPTANYDAGPQADRVSGVIKALKPKNPQVDVIGNSMGGFISAELALRHPEQVHSVGLMDAAGVSSPTPSVLRQQIEAGKNGFFAKDMPGFHDFYAMTMSQPPFVPGFVLDAVGEQAIARVARHEYIFNQLNGPRLDDQLSKIKVPTLIIWGDEDKLLHISMASIWRKIPGSRVFVFKGIGHMPHLERPTESAELYTKFLNKTL